MQFVQGFGRERETAGRPLVLQDPKNHADLSTHNVKNSASHSMILSH
jgi:hypothetical protein